MVRISAVGDVRLTRPEAETRLRHVAEHLRSSDIAFCQNECTYSDVGSMGSNGPRGVGPNTLVGYPAFADSGFDVVSMATNHAMDWGRDALLDTLRRMRADGIAVVGAGATLDEARRPVVVERGGTTFAFLAYCSVAPIGYYAAPERAGVVPLRAFVSHVLLEEDQPGTPPETRTWPVPEDLDAMVADISTARGLADVVVVSMHKGVHYIRSLVADYERVVAHAAVDAGAHLVLGHGAHMLKGVEVYRGVAIFHSLGNFAFDINTAKNPDPWWKERVHKVYRTFGSQMLHTGEGALSVLAQIDFADAKVTRVAMLPVAINDRQEPVPAPVGTAEGDEIAAYVEAITAEADLGTTFRREGEVLVVELD
jgi:poly-gamma-glutamate capsule biosynthesis protein CapA/YwtB (metallophosphatase superfamily)